MNLTARKFCKSPCHRARIAVAVLCVFLLTAVPALAEPVRMGHVVQTLSLQGAPVLKLDTIVSQDPSTAAGTKGGPRNDSQASAKGTKPESIIAGVNVTPQDPQLGVETIEEGEVEGTICDCGEILIAGGAFPKWPFLFLGAIPLIFIHHDCEDCDKETSSPTPTPTPPTTPTPTPTPSGVPEPASLLLFGTGLAAFGAGLRRRYAKSKAQQQEEE